MKHNYPGTNRPASLNYLRLVAPSRRGNLDWWAGHMAPRTQS